MIEFNIKLLDAVVVSYQNGWLKKSVKACETIQDSVWYANILNWKHTKGIVTTE